MRVLCVSAQLPGHLDWGGFAGTAVALQERGHELLWASGREVLPLLQARGLRPHLLERTGWRWPPPPPLRPGPGETSRAIQEQMQRRSLDQWLDVERVAAATIELAAVAERFRPDLIVSEMFMASAGLVAEQIDVPFAVAGWPAPSPSGAANDQPLVAEARGRLNALLGKFSLCGINWTETGPPALRSPRLHVTYWNDRWFGAAATPPTRHVGGIATPGSPEHVPANETLPPQGLDPWVLITLGTSFNDDPHFFVAAVSAADRMGAIPLVVHGRSSTDESIKRLRQALPASARTYAMLDLHAVLPHVVAAIHHGGAGTTHALVTHAVPQVVVPHAADQHRQAQGVARTEVGFHIAPRQASPDNLAQALALLMPDRSAYRENAEDLRREFAALGGIDRAADLLARLVAEAI